MCWGSLMVKARGQVVWREHLRGKRGGLGSMGEGPRQGENLGSGGSPVKGLLGAISGTGWWEQQLSWPKVWAQIPRGGSVV